MMEDWLVNTLSKLRRVIRMISNALLSMFLKFTWHNEIVTQKQISTKQSVEFDIACWNIGHFSKGRKPYSVIGKKKFIHSKETLLSVLYNIIQADIICLNEYSEVFCIDKKSKIKKTEDLFFNSYNYREIGPLRGFSCNSIFSQIKIQNTKVCEFEVSKTVSLNMKRAANYYYVECELLIGDVVAKLICAHTISDAHNICQLQIAELLNKYRSCKRVILCGDWNTTDFSQFINAGYTLANDGSLKTLPRLFKSYAIDNILVKGFTVSNTWMVKTTISDHCPIVCRLSLSDLNM